MVNKGGGLEGGQTREGDEDKHVCGGEGQTGRGDEKPVIEEGGKAVLFIVYKVAVL
jgi:hypothetical protein